jgi:hypothetical protein
MKQRIQLTIIVLVLTLLGSGLALYKHFKLDFPFLPSEKETVWTVEAAIAAPKLLGVVKTQGNVRELGEFLARHTAFVMKPSKGSGGKGILVINGKDGPDFIKSSGTRIDLREVERHASNTLSGLYSLGGNIDAAMIEELVDFADTFDGFSYQGVPDTVG